MSNCYERGVALYRLGRYQLAEKELRQHLLESPNDGNALRTLALCRMYLINALGLTRY